MTWRAASKASRLRALGMLAPIAVLLNLTTPAQTSPLPSPAVLGVSQSSGLEAAGSTVCTLSDYGTYTFGPDVDLTPAPGLGRAYTLHAVHPTRNAIRQYTLATTERISGQASATGVGTVGFSFISPSDPPGATVNIRFELVWDVLGQVEAVVSKLPQRVNDFAQAHARFWIDGAYQNLTANPGIQRGTQTLLLGDHYASISGADPYSYSGQRYETGLRTATWTSIPITDSDNYYFYAKITTDSFAKSRGVFIQSAAQEDFYNNLYWLEAHSLKMTILTPGWTWTTCTG